MGIGNLTEADRGGFDRGERDAHRRLPGAWNPGGADDGGDSVGLRAVREIGIARPADALRRDTQNDPQGRGRSAGDDQGPVVLTYTEDELRAPAGAPRPELPLFADADAITVLNNERFVRGTNIQEIFSQLDVDEPSHAFYLGRSWLGRVWR